MGSPISVVLSEFTMQVIEQTIIDSPPPVSNPVLDKICRQLSYCYSLRGNSIIPKFPKLNSSKNLIHSGRGEKLVNTLFRYECQTNPWLATYFRSVQKAYQLREILRLSFLPPHQTQKKCRSCIVK